MMTDKDAEPKTDEQLTHAIVSETLRFEKFYRWLEKEMPSSLFKEVDQKNIMLIAHNLMGLALQDNFSILHLKNSAIAICLDSPDADVRILKNFGMYGVKNYRAYVSHSPPPIDHAEELLRIGVVRFTEAAKTLGAPLTDEDKASLQALVKQRNPEMSAEQFEKLYAGMDIRLLRSIPKEGLTTAFDMFSRAQTRDNCQYEVEYIEDWEKTGSPSLRIVFAWKNTPKAHFIYRLARTVHRHGLIMKRVNGACINPFTKESILVMGLGLHGGDGRAAWDVADLPDFLRELVTLKYFQDFDRIDSVFVTPGILNGNMGNLLRSMVTFIHQILLNVDPHRYDIKSVEEGLCRHPDLTSMLCQCFYYRFHPQHRDEKQFAELKEEFLALVDKLDTGREENDERRKNVLRQGLNFTEHTLKTNFYRNNKTAFCFRLDPKYLDNVPFRRSERFPELPYGIFFAQGMHFFAFHVRFKDLSRGGIRTVFPDRKEVMVAERRTVFRECYNLAYTQHKKNKDIPEGGAKGVIFLQPSDQLKTETQILSRELQAADIDESLRREKLEKYSSEQKSEYLYAAQRSFIESLMSIVNCDPDGTLRAKNIVDYWGRPEYVYLGPDENMHDSMIEWIAQFSKNYHYKPGGSFISGKPSVGINHKEYGVTSLGVNVYMHEALLFLGINPKKDKFTIKISGGPDGDVAGNQIYNLQKHYPKTAKLLALTDGSGTVHDPKGLDLDILVDLFRQGQPIKYYPPQKLHDGSFLLDRTTKRSESAYVQQTLCWRKKGSKVSEDWLSTSDMSALFRHNVHSVQTDVFVPGGGRPRTLNDHNFEDFLNHDGEPTSRAIVEGANLYLTNGAREKLEEKGVLIFKDSSANKCGVICSSYEILSGLTLGDEQFLKNKKPLVKEILKRLEDVARSEAKLILSTHEKTGERLTVISDQVSERINLFRFQILDFLDPLPFPDKTDDPLVRAYLDYCPTTLTKKFEKELLNEVPDHHKKAVIACHLGAKLVYERGLDWLPSIVDILPSVLKEI